jgi:hypothetical protein
MKWNLLSKILNVIMIILTLFLAVTAIPGGVVLMANIYAPPVEQLQDSIFSSFTIPGIALALIVGGSAVVSAILLINKSKFGAMSTATAGVIIMFFEFVEVMIIGSPTGPARVMQIIYFGLGTLLMVASIGSWFLDLAAERS